jgi:hypothetical protein
MTDRKIISRRRLHGIHGTPTSDPLWGQFGDVMPALSILLALALAEGQEKIYLCGSLEQMTKEYCNEPIGDGWAFAHPFTFKHRAPVYRSREGREIAVKLISHREGWFPGCERRDVAIDAWDVLRAEWVSVTGLPLLSSPSKTGQAYLWEMLPKGQSFPSLPADVEKIVRANSPQHRIEKFNTAGHLEWFKVGADEAALYQYDGRWMYASLATLDRLPIGEPRPAEEFEPYAPGLYHVIVRIPSTWQHVGLVPYLGDNGWEYPSEPGRSFSTFAWEPELTEAQKNGWQIDVCGGWVFDKGCPLEPWASKLIEMRERFGNRDHYVFARAAVRQILNHAIGSLHARGYERELFVSGDNWRMWRRENAAWFDSVSGRKAEQVEGGWLVSHWVPDNSPLSINMPHWSATIWALERARIAQHALKCDPSTLVKINGDAIYMTAPAPWDGEDNGRVGQLRRKES